MNTLLHVYFAINLLYAGYLLGIDSMEEDKDSPIIRLFMLLVLSLTGSILLLSGFIISKIKKLKDDKVK